MATTLMTTWSEYNVALDQVLALAKHQISIFDHDLQALKIDQPNRIEILRRLLLDNPKHRVRIVIQDVSTIASRNPRLMRLQSECSHNLSITEASDSVAHLADSMVIADDSQALVRFHRDHARSKVIENDPDATMPYLRRFEDIVGEGGTPFSMRPAGL